MYREKLNRNYAFNIFQKSEYSMSKDKNGSLKERIKNNRIVFKFNPLFLAQRPLPELFSSKLYIKTLLYLFFQDYLG